MSKKVSWNDGNISVKEYKSKPSNYKNTMSD